MFDKKEILKILNDENYFINKNVLDTFITNWKIDAIYENEEGVDFFDTLSIEKIKKGISLKSQGYDNEGIVYRINKIHSSQDPVETQQTSKETQLAPVIATNNMTTAETTNNLTIDITSQTLQMIAEAVAQKITTDVKSQFESANFVEELIEAGSFKKDNEILAAQVNTLLEDNKKMSQRLAQLESKKSFWSKLFK